MAPPPLLTLAGLRLELGAQTLFSGIDLAIGPSDRLCLLGRNGAGKSTLLKIIAGIIEADGGERFVRPGVSIAYLPQEPDLGRYDRLFDYVAAGLPSSQADAAFRVEAALAEVNLPADANPRTLSGGEQRRAAIARAFLGEPDVLLLDEPTNHLDLPTIEWLEGRLAAFRGAIIVISHDRAFLSRLASACLWLDRGVVKRLERGFAAFEEWVEQEYARDATETAKLDKLIAEETRWSREGISARRTRNQGRLRRLDGLRQERRSRIARSGTAALAAAEGKTSGKLVIEAKSISKSFGERVLLNDFSTRIMRGDRIGIIGPNGAGKSTLLKLLTGEVAPDSGVVRLGTNLEMLLIDQKRDSLDPDLSLWETLTGGSADQVMVRGQPKHVVAYLKDFLFSPAQARGPVRALSGGEKNRLMLARALAKPSNLMILDEPTNDLDMETLDLLQEVLSDYEGTILLVSHDRDFLDRLVTSTIVLDGNGAATEYAGGYTDSLRQAAQAPKTSDPQKPSTRLNAALTSRPPQKPKNPGKRMSFKQKHALEQLPEEMRALEQDISLLEKAIADPQAYSRDPDKFMLASKKLDRCRAELEEKEEEWLALEMLREELENE
ncbi:elongation factor 3 [Iodidimonas gelatinilytica]|uniref:ATP-binding protein Uup n=1 Tax=Iodidimonas gelatinilytica TaxID=1236966 RepID=A0A5A7MTL6_9PROT|nr:ATP-binding cassette domain-containing protein [Iodidimonas gelatinilytica]GEQ99146.1 elongation factor 3 [Iodidimonas gelatinilytica]GER01982.1 elongation factor 3 [Iodidimonas gelatinilytica]